MEKKASAEKTVREIRRKTRRRFSAEEKIRIDQRLKRFLKSAIGGFRP